MVRMWFSARPRFVTLSGLLLLGLGGCGAREPAAKATVTVTVDEKTHGCMVALSTEAQGSSIGCDDVVPFIRDELRVPIGATYAIGTAADTDPALLAKVDANLQGAGYRSLPGSHGHGPT